MLVQCEEFYCTMRGLTHLGRHVNVDGIEFGFEINVPERKPEPVPKSAL